jgi:hypothetical protein
MAIRFRDGRKAPWIVYWRNPFTGKMEEEPYSSKKDAKKANSIVKHRLKMESLPDIPIYGKICMAEYGSLTI